MTPGIPDGRKPGSCEWYEIQDNIAYWQEFEQPKIIVPAITDTVNYAGDKEGFYSDDKTNIFIPPSIDFTLAVLNSNISMWLTLQEFASKQGGFFEFKPMYVSKLPIPPATPEEQAELEQLTRRLTELKSEGAAPEKLAALEEQVNDRVADLFRLTPDERRLIAAG